MDYIASKLSNDILKSAVAKEHGVKADSIMVSNVSFKPGSKKGDGFSCDIAAVDFIVTITGDTEETSTVSEKHYIAKYGPEGTRGDLLEEMGSFKQEHLSYTWLVPTLQEMRASRNLKPLAIPKCFYSSVEQQLMIFENIKIQKYATVEKTFQPLSLEALKLVLIELAAFHASGYHYIQSHPGGLKALQASQPDIFMEDFFGRKGSKHIFDDFLDMITKMFHSCALVAKKFGPGDMGDRMMGYKANVSVITDLLLDEMPEKMGMILHGDAWYNNFLYRFSEENKSEPESVAIVDLQNTRFGRIGLELAYFFTSTVSRKQRKEHLDELLGFYYERFIQELKDFGSNLESVFTFEELKKDFNECYAFGIVTGCMHAQIHLVSEDSNAQLSFDDINDVEARTNMLNSMELEVLAKAESCSGFRDLVLGLAEEGVERRIF